MGNKIKPLSRKEGIVVQELKGEVLIYDLRENKAFCLNETSALVWKACDGSKTVTEISKSIGNEDVVWLALDQLKKENLIDGEVENKFAGVSRREVIKKIGLGSMLALPVIASLVAPVAAQTGTCVNPGGAATGSPVTGTDPSSVQCRRILDAQCCRNAVTNYTFNSGSNTCSGFCA